MSAYHAVGHTSDMTDGQQKVVRVGTKDLLLCRAEGQFFAVENRCSHDNEALIGGRLIKCSIVCPFHGARFNLRNGAAFGPPAVGPITIYPVRVVDDVVEVCETPAN